VAKEVSKLKRLRPRRAGEESVIKLARLDPPADRFSIVFVLATVVVLLFPMLLIKYWDSFGGIGIGALLSIAWTVLFFAGVGKIGARFYWFSLTAPFGLFWPLLIIRWLYGSSVGDPDWMLP